MHRNVCLVFTVFKHCVRPRILTRLWLQNEQSPAESGQNLATIMKTVVGSDQVIPGMIYSANHVDSCCYFYSPHMQSLFLCLRLLRFLLKPECHSSNIEIRYENTLENWPLTLHVRFFFWSLICLYGLFNLALSFCAAATQRTDKKCNTPCPILSEITQGVVAVCVLKPLRWSNPAVHIVAPQDNH